MKHRSNHVSKRPLSHQGTALGLAQLSFRTSLIGKSILAADINGLRRGVK
jgi:hypothetical protein